MDVKAMILPVVYPDSNLPIERQSDLMLLTMCLWGEAIEVDGFRIKWRLK